MDTVKHICPRCASILEYIDVDDTDRWNPELAQGPNNCLNRLFILGVNKQAVWNTPIRFEPEQSFVDFLIKSAIRIRLRDNNELIK